MSRIGAGMLLHGEVLTVDEVLARVEALTLDDVHDGGPGRGRRAPHPVGGRRRSTSRTSTPSALGLG